MTDFQKVFEYSPYPYLLISPELFVLAVNESYLATAKIKRNEIVGKALLDVFPDKPNNPAFLFTEAIKKSLQIVIETKKVHQMVTSMYVLPQKKGEFQEGLWNIFNTPVLDDSGKLISIIHNIIDVTALIKSQKNAEFVEARELENRIIHDLLKLDHIKLEKASHELGVAIFELRLFIQMNPVPMVLWRGEEHTYAIVNDAHNTMLRRSVIGKTIREALSPEEAKGVPELLDRVYETGEPFISKENHYRVNDLDGKTRSIWVNEWFYPLRTKEGEVKAILGVAQDVSEQVAARNALIEKQAQLHHSIFALEQEHELREQFVATLTHDLRVPLSAAKLSSQMIARKAEDTDSVRRLSDKVNANIDRIDSMIRDMLDANRIKAGETLPLDISEFDLTQVVKDTIDDLGTEFGDCFLMESPLEPVVGRWSLKDLRRVLENLCSNAVKYGSNEDKVIVKILPTGSNITISVLNYGNVISPEDQKNLFEPYRRTDSAFTGQAKGWGLGLTLVKGIVEAHKGTVKVESSADKGTIFTVKLPLDSTRQS